MPGWDQTPGGQVLWTDDLELITTEDETELVTGDDAGGWHAFQLAKTAVNAEFAQDASWEAAGNHVINSAGWEQAAATWDAASSLQLTAEATFEQIAEWEAEASSALGAVNGSGAWSQAATWAANGSLPVEESEGGGKGRWLKLKHRRYIDSASFGQVSAWSAEMNVKAPRPDEVEELVLVGAI